MKTKLKICGLTRAEDVQKCVELNTWAIGFNFYNKSPRFLEIGKAKELCSLVPSHILKIGVFVKSSPQEIQRIAQKCKLDAVQLYECNTSNSKDYFQIYADHKVPSDNNEFFLLDANSPQFGGTGLKANWDIISQVPKETKVILAGGLGPNNIAAAISETNEQVFAYDICSSIETEPGVKDHSLIDQLFEEAS
jgi:phosphoribosylanthranilate isomerase